ncbi:DUF4398 domain-containing protein [Myxococcota bacterium]|nr:DUF4398 domain-containing protein [Myxococcota bacterium]
MGSRSCRDARCLPLLPLAAIVAIVGCGPVQSGTLIVDAQAELAAAQTAGGDRHAPFEYVAAEEYLHKAREEQSYADFEVSVEFARKARTCARAAKLLAERATRSTMGVDAATKKITPCRAGPDRGPGSLAASEEPAARGLPIATTAEGSADETMPASTVGAPKQGGEPEDPPPEPAPKKKVKKADAEPDDPPPPPVKPKKKAAAEPEEEPEDLPEGDE